MADRFKFAEVRQQVIEMLKTDLLGPSCENEILSQNPRFEYIVGMLAPQTSEDDGSNEQEIDGDVSFDGDADANILLASARVLPSTVATVTVLGILVPQLKNIVP